MLYRTHKMGGTLSMLLVFQYMQSKGMMIDGLNPFVQLAIMYPASSWGSVAPDLDHGWSNVKEKTAVNYAVHKALHLTKPRHRSWQTHSLLVTGGLCVVVSLLVVLGTMLGWGLNKNDWILISLIVHGGTIGIVSHLILDAFSVGGVHIIPGKIFRFVPRSNFFATGGAWETFIFRVLSVAVLFCVINIICGIYGTTFLDLVLNLLHK